MDILYFFSARGGPGGGKGESEAPGGGVGSIFYWNSQGRRRGKDRRAKEGVCGELGNGRKIRDFQKALETIRESETTIKVKLALFRGGLGRGAGRKIIQNAIFHGKRHDNKILKVKILLSRNLVVMAQALETTTATKRRKI